jgi:lysophospholipase L1-like esterase
VWTRFRAGTYHNRNDDQIAARMIRRYERYVAIGDSSTEGLDDPDGSGGYRGWADRLAGRIARLQGSLRYANLGVRGLRTRQVLEGQLAPALAMKPDLATLFTGTNDVIGAGFDARRIGGDIERMQRELIRSGATVLGFTLPDLTPLIPLARLIAPRVRALNEALRVASRSSGAILVDFARYPVATDARLWSEDRIHANALGHARIAAALAEALGHPASGEAWDAPLPASAPRSPRSRLGAELAWIRRHLLPWLWNGGGARRSSFHPKRPVLAPIEIDD